MGIDQYISYINSFAGATTILPDGEVSGEICYWGDTEVEAGNIYAWVTGGTWELAEHNSTANLAINKLAVAVDTGVSSTVGMLLYGYVRNTDKHGGIMNDEGQPLYLKTLGTIQTAAPTSSGNYARIIGHTVNPDKNLMHFNPDSTWVQIP
jgi:hypothetical protein